MRTIVTTARSGEMLREYAAKMSGCDGIVAFPEAGLSPIEQACFMEQSAGRYCEVITFSSFIISDADVGCLRVLGAEANVYIKHGDSVNRVTMSLGQRDTIGSIAAAKLASARSAVSKALSADDINEIIDGVVRLLGDSVEKTLFVKMALDRIDSLNATVS